MKATFGLDTINNRYVFTAPDFSLRFAISHVIQKIDDIVLNTAGVLELVCNGYEEHIDLPYVTHRLGIEWDYSKYDIEVIKR